MKYNWHVATSLLKNARQLSPFIDRRVATSFSQLRRVLTNKTIGTSIAAVRSAAAKRLVGVVRAVALI